MIVDCHTHLTLPADEIRIAEHLEACEKVDACIVLPVSSEKSQDANKDISERINKYSKLIGFGVVNPVREKVNAKILKSMVKGLGLNGAVLYCAGDGFHPTHSRAMRFYEAAQQMSLPVFFSNGVWLTPGAVLDYAQPYLLDEVARTFPNLKIIIGSMGLPFLSQTICMISKHPHVYADLTISPHKIWETYNIVVSAHEAGVMDKLLFGSGYPFAEPGRCIETLLGFNRMLSDKTLRTVPREKIRSIIERETLELLGIKKKNG